MKPLIAFLTLCILSLSSYSQTYPSPEFNNEPSYYDTTTHALIGLEKSSYNRLNQAKGLMGKEAGFFLEHAKSSVRFKSSPAISFIMKVTPGTNPTSILDFAAFEIRGDQRVLITTKLTKAGTKSTTSVEKITYQVQKIGEGLYLLTATNIKPGEYLLGTHDNMFAFGIDN
jgi:hypothetical protein